jgi:FHA domain/Double zinc ribbon
VTYHCPAGHESSTADYCDECGAPMQASARDDSSPGADPSAEHEDSTTVTLVERCPRCTTIRMPGDRFCETCRWDFDDPDGGLSASGWSVHVEADRAYWERLGLTDVPFPDRFDATIVVLDREELLVGRRSPERGIEPDFDLGPYEDPAVSRRHARFVRCEEGHYAIVDLDSANGTWLNDADHPIPAGVAVPLSDGDRIHVGAWLTLRVCRTDPSAT